MSNQKNNKVFTTNAEDQAAVKELNDRLKSSSVAKTQACGSSSSSLDKVSIEKNWKPVPSVILAEGAHKYVLISARPIHEKDAEGEGYDSYFVTSKRGAYYHRNAAEVVIDRLEASGYTNINVLGGGRIFLDEKNKKISIFGFSYGFGRADHMISQNVIEADERYKDYDVTWSNDGY